MGVGDLVGYARGALIEEIEGARRRILLVSPYITGRVAKEIAEAAERSRAGERRLITELTERSVRSRVLDPKGLLRLKKAGFEVAQLEGLHAKVSIDLPSYPRPKTKLKKVGESIAVIGTARLKEMLEEPVPADRSYWLDPNYHDYSDEGWWRRRGWVSDRREVGIKASDLIVITRCRGGQALALGDRDRSRRRRPRRRWGRAGRDRHHGSIPPGRPEGDFAQRIRKLARKLVG